MPTDRPTRLLTEGLQTLGIELPADTRRRLLDYVALLEKWNTAYNLTAVRDPEQMVVRHLLDSLVVLPYVKGPHVLDIGTGAGLPGIPLALARPDLAFVLLDSNAKKTRFVTQAVAELGLKNVAVVQDRVEKYRPGQKFDTLISRAFASLPDILTGAQALCHPGSEFLAMKGTYPEKELAAIPAPFRVKEAHALSVPGLDAARHLIVIVVPPV